MRVLITGKGTSGSWKVRGEQLGAAIGATVKPCATSRDIAAHDLVVLVKRPTSALADALRRCGRPVVWDVVDHWPQPCGNDWTRDRLIMFTRESARHIGATAVIGATATMAEDLDSPHWLPHHGWERGEVTPRSGVRAVCYEGAARYLGRWHDTVAEECRRRGWAFLVNPATYTDCDIAIAFRDAEFDGYAPRHWKSGVKLSNAQVAGLAFVGAREAGYVEQSCGAERFVDDPAQLRSAFDHFESQPTRAMVAAEMRAAAPRLADVASKYLGILQCVARS